MRHACFPCTLLLLAWTFLSCSQENTYARQDRFSDFLSRSEIVIAVTDSGLGGLSTVAETEARMRERGPFRKVEFVFVSALFSNQGGYNSLPDRESKIRVFDSALESIETRFSPDLLLIACNTLSALYESTSFSRRTRIPVKGIVDTGVDLIAENLRGRPDSKVILFGTQTTIEEDVHRSRLLDRGFLPERIITQSCPDLVPYIERGFDSAETEMLIFAYVDEALQKTANGRQALFVSFNCTHYGYARKLWEKAFAGLGVIPAGFLNPNPKMADFLFRGEGAGRFDSPDISIKVYSMVEIGEAQRDSIGRWLDEVSPAAAAALRDYQKVPGLFEID